MDTIVTQQTSRWLQISFSVAAQCRRRLPKRELLGKGFAREQSKITAVRSSGASRFPNDNAKQSTRMKTIRNERRKLASVPWSNRVSGHEQ
jgi:hypothetical protein